MEKQDGQFAHGMLLAFNNPRKCLSLVIRYAQAVVGARRERPMGSARKSSAGPDGPNQGRMVPQLQLFRPEHVEREMAELICETSRDTERGRGNAVQSRTVGSVPANERIAYA
jgi:hypothetical protein